MLQSCELLASLLQACGMLQFCELLALRLQACALLSYALLSFGALAWVGLANSPVCGPRRITSRLGQ